MYVCQKEELHMTKAEKVADVIVRQHFTNTMELMEYLDCLRQIRRTRTWKDGLSRHAF